MAGTRFQGLVAASVSGEPGNIPGWLMRSYSGATLRSYMGALARCVTLLGSSAEPFQVGIQRVLLILLGPEKSGSPIRLLLSALGLLQKLRFMLWEVPRVWWRLTTVANRLQARGEGCAADPQWFGRVCDHCHTPADWAFLDTCLFAFV